MAILAAWAAELLWSGKSRVGPGKVLSLSILDHNVGYRKLPANPASLLSIQEPCQVRPCVPATGYGADTRCCVSTALSMSRKAL